MEPIYLCRDESKFIEWYADHATHVALTRAEYDALVKRDRTCPLCGDELDPDEADYDSVCPPAGAGVCSQCFARWHDAPLYEKRADAATARAEKAERERDDARAALDAQIATVLAAHLDAPTHDDRRGEDGEAVQAAGSSS